MARRILVTAYFAFSKQAVEAWVDPLSLKFPVELSGKRIAASLGKAADRETCRGTIAENSQQMQTEPFTVHTEFPLSGFGVPRNLLTHIVTATAAASARTFAPIASEHFRGSSTHKIPHSFAGAESNLLEVKRETAVEHVLNQHNPPRESASEGHKNLSERKDLNV